MSMAQRYAGFLEREAINATTPVKAEAIRQAANKLLELDRENKQLRSDAARLDWLADHGTFGADSVTGEPGGNGQRRIPATRVCIDEAMTWHDDEDAQRRVDDICPITCPRRQKNDKEMK